MILEGLSSPHLVKRKEVWKAEGWPEIQILESTPEEWRIEGAKADAFAVNPAASWRLRDQLKFLPAECVRLEQFDLITKELGSWTAHLVLREVFMHWIPRKKPDLSGVSWAYLCGDARNISLFSSVVSHLGYTRIALIQNSEQDHSTLIPRLQRQNLGIQFQILQLKELSVMPNNGSILMNSLSLEEDVPFMETLSYLNFLGKGSMVIDLNMPPIENALLAETARVGLMPVSGLEWIALSDHWMLQKIFRTTISPPKLDLWRTSFQEGS